MSPQSHIVLFQIELEDFSKFMCDGDTHEVLSEKRVWCHHHSDGDIKVSFRKTRSCSECWGRRCWGKDLVVCNFFLCNLSTIFRVNSLLESTQGFFPRLNWLRGRVNITSKQTGKALIPFPGKSVDYRQPKVAIYGFAGAALTSFEASWRRAWEGAHSWTVLQKGASASTRVRWRTVSLKDFWFIISCMHKTFLLQQTNCIQQRGAIHS